MRTSATMTVIRDFMPTDAEGVSSLFRAIYGPRYVYPEVYLPSLIRERNADGKWHSAIAELDGEIVAHAALLHDRDAPGQAEIALTVASPKVAGRGTGVRVCRHLRDRAPQWGISMLTAILVSSHVQSQRMANPLGFGTTGLLLDYLPSSFLPNARESYVLACLPLMSSPLPCLDWPDGCAHWLNAITARIGVLTDAGQSRPAFAAPVDVQSDGVLIVCTLNEISDNALDEVCSMPPQRLKLVRLLLGPSLRPACERLLAAGYRHTGIMPAGGGSWYWLMQSSFRKEQVQLHCPLARHIWKDAVGEDAFSRQHNPETVGNSVTRVVHEPMMSGVTSRALEFV